ncbi:MAG: hypothetical protein JHD07_16730 [Bradyrhizobium sp.]|uniref:hypothetical protein n=1 Tax=Bradyrhizobium sp. TaxID=376 RepID=UPI001A271CCE|nr:hypothetical protein [Bradyrhizobium sp.]MBJ7404848.1 hypothetical protein [Bradyrhizobium sp.]
MTRLSRDDVVKAVNRADDVTIAQIIGTGATADILSELDEDEDDGVEPGSAP